MSTVTFREALDLVESLSDEERLALVEIVKRRLVERRRDEIAESVREARENYARGEVRKGTADDLLRDLRG
ncbi:MAG: hypothetical protein HY281_13475 [Nitrospirae bacterium]|nr:hypothetical protein [Nitrospirota bacterium]